MASARALCGVGVRVVVVGSVLWGLCGVPGVARAGDLQFLRGDMNNDGRVSISDASQVLLWLGQSGEPPPCQAAADMDRDGHLWLTDPVNLLNFLFLGKGEILAPYPACGTDPAGPSALPCDGAPHCGSPVPPLPGRFQLFVTTRANSTEPDDGAAMLSGLPGDVVDLPFHVHLRGSAETDQGALSWSFGVAAESETVHAEISEATMNGTRAAQVFDGGYKWAEPAGAAGAVSSIVLSFVSPVSTAHGRAATEVLRGNLRVTIPAVEGRLFVRPAEGLRGSGQPVELEVTGFGLEGAAAYKPDAIALEVRVQPLEPVVFVRGDSNLDGLRDISDAVHILTHLFLGSASLACLDAADTNDNGTVDLSDAVLALGCLFLGTACPPPPFPGCGVDPTQDALGCDMPAPDCT